MRNHARTLEERDFIVLGLFRVTKRDPSKNRETENIGNNNDEYAIGEDDNNKPLAEGDQDDDKYATDSNIADKDKEFALGSLNGQEHHTLSAAR
jgi:hypothetical protein